MERKLTAEEIAELEQALDQYEGHIPDCDCDNCIGVKSKVFHASAALTEAVGENLAKWSKGEAAPKAATITESQAGDLQALIEEVGADQDRFLRHYQIGSLYALPVAKHKEALAQLEKKRRVGAP